MDDESAETRIKGHADTDHVLCNKSKRKKKSGDVESLIYFSVMVI